jgi:hypothetical protein
MSFDNGELFIINKFLFSDRCRCVRRWSWFFLKCWAIKPQDNAIPPKYLR